MNTLPYPSQALASQGRYGDSTLVHMNPQEVSGLQALARRNGTSLTVNPQTGLPEAFSLKGILPALIGAGLTIGSGGALSPLAAGLMTGAGYGLATGDVKQGLMAGLGAYGGAGMGAGFSAAGAAAPGAAVPSIAGGGGAAELASVGQTGFGMTGPMTPTIGQNFAQAGQGVGALGTEAGRSGFMGGVGGGMGLAKSSAALAAPMMFGGDEGEGLKAHEHYLRPYDLDITNVSGTYDPLESSREREQLSYNFRARDPIRVAQGGAIRYQEGGLAAMMRPEEAITPPMNGRFLRGNGDGMSDEIPASIEGEQDALLSDGEFVIPADVVSHIGNGSSEAGAKILYQMMDRVRKARTGQEEQAEEIDVEEFLPA
jgi:hypothetical protein